MTLNHLAGETSPYLRQHADNPVAWWPWGPDALAEAKRTNRPILLSVGYAACHWCHVMAHENFEDAVIAGQMNRDFVNIKVDREERPDIDQIYQSALALLGESGGWPLTMFLTPDGKPFWGGTYFPPTARYGRPGFPEVLAAVARIYREDPGKITQNVQALTDGLAALAPAPGDGEIPVSMLDRIADRLVGAIDPRYGGLGGAPKFPQPNILGLLWRAYRRTDDPRFGQAVERSLIRMAQGGIYDHLGGGFARYATDAAWLVPHFEKMLYDNAQLVELMTEVWATTRKPLLAARVAETIGWMTTELADPGGAFYASFDADSEGEEGRYYVWQAAEIDRILGPDAPAFKAAYNVTTEGNWEGRSILTRGVADDLADTEPDLAASRQRLLAVRRQRVPPGRDEKILADWNGLAIAALAAAGATFDRPDWIAAGRRAFAFVHAHLRIDGRLCHSFCAGRAAHPATLDDHANLARAALALAEATAEPSYVDHAIALVADLDRSYRDDARGGYYLTAADTPDLIVRTKTAADAAVPSGNGTMVGVLARLHALTGDDRYRTQAEAVVAAFAGELGRNLFPLATLLGNAELLQRSVQVAIAGSPDDPATAALRAAVFGLSCPNRVLTMVPDARALPETHPARGKHAPDGQPAAFVCVGQTCSLPVQEPAALTRLLEQSC